MNLNSLADDLKNIPQAKLIQYVQDPNSVVPQFLALAEIQRRKSLERSAGAGAPQTTVAQDIMAQAQPIPQAAGIAGLPPQAAPQGVPSLPSGMGQQSFAGGGIVAFAKGDEVEDPYAALSFEEKLKRLRAAEDEDTDLSKNRMFRRNRELPDMFSMGNFNKNLQQFQPEDESKRGVVTPAQATYSASAPKYTSPDQYVPGSRVDPAVIGHATNGSSDSTKPSKPRVKASDAAKELNVPQVEPKEDMFGKYEKMFNAQAAEAKAGREQDKWMRLLEAGLGIMGGTSPYAMTNIGQGAMGAVKGYAQDLAAQRKEERENVKDLMGIGLKREEAEREAKKLSIMEKEATAKGGYYGAYADYLRSGKGGGAETKMDIAQLNAIKSTFATLQKDAANLGSPNYGKSPIELWNLATQMVTPNASGGNMAPATSMPTYNPQTRTFK